MGGSSSGQGDEMERAPTQEFCLGLELKPDVRPEILSRGTTSGEVTRFVGGKSLTEKLPTKNVIEIQRAVRMNFDGRTLIFRCIYEGADERNLNRQGDFTGMAVATSESLDDGRLSPRDGKLFIDGAFGIGGNHLSPSIDGQLDDVLTLVQGEVANCWSCFLPTGVEYITPGETRKTQRGEFSRLVERGLQNLQKGVYQPSRLKRFGSRGK